MQALYLMMKTTSPQVQVQVPNSIINRRPAVSLHQDSILRLSKQPGPASTAQWQKTQQLCSVRLTYSVHSIPGLRDALKRSRHQPLALAHSQQRRLPTIYNLSSIIQPPLVASPESKPSSLQSWVNPLGTSKAWYQCLSPLVADSDSRWHKPESPGPH